MSARRPARLRPAALGLLALLLATGSPARAEDEAAALARAQAALAEGRAEEAREAFEALLREAGALEPPAPRSRLDPLRRGLGAALLRLGRPLEALDPLEALARDGLPEDALLYAEALVAHARATLAEGAGGRVGPYLEDALDAAARAQGLSGLDERRLLVTGEARALSGDADEAVKAWAQVPWDEPPSAAQRWAHACRARLLYDLGRFAESAGLYERLGDRRGAAAAFAAAREPAKALVHYAALLAATPSDAALLDDAVAAARYAGQSEELERLLAGLWAEPGAGRGLEGAGAVALLRARARLREHRGDRPGAAALLREAGALPEGSGDPALAIDRARVLLALPADDPGSPREEATTALRAAWAAHPGDDRLAEVLLAVAQAELARAWQAYPDRGPVERSVALQRDLLRERPGDALAWANLGNTLKLHDGAEEALRAFERAAEEAPEDALLLNDFGLAALAAGEGPRAEGLFLRALEADPGQLSALQNLARARWREGRDRESREFLERAARAALVTGRPHLLYRALSDRAWRTLHRPDRR